MRFAGLRTEAQGLFVLLHPPLPHTLGRIIHAEPVTSTHRVWKICAEAKAEPRIFSDRLLNKD